MATAVGAAIAHVGRQYFPIAPIWIGQKYSSTRVAGADVAGYGPQCPRLVDDSSQYRSPDAPLAVPHRDVRRGTPLWRRGSVSHDGRLRSFGSFELALLGETRWFDSGWCMGEKYQPDVRDPRLERGDKNLVGRVALGRRGTGRHRWMGRESDD